MHLHGIAATQILGSLEATDSAQRAANAQRAADVRKQLAKSAAQTGLETNLDALVLLGQPHSGGRQAESSSDNPTPESEAIPKTDDESSSAGHRSYWA